MIPTRSERFLRRRGPLVAGIAAVVLSITLGTLIALRPGESLLDTEWMEEVIEHRSPLWTAPALFFDVVGGGLVGTIVVPVLVVLSLLAFRRPWGALFFAVASAASAAAVQVLKQLFGRARPPDDLVAVDPGSFPSGHTANAVIMALVLALILRVAAAWIAGAAWAVLMAASRTYLGAHWITDTVGGALLGAGIAVIVGALLAARLAAERPRDHRFLLLPPRWPSGR